MRFKRAIAQSLSTAAVLLATPRAFADDTPVEKPAVDRPALPQTSPATPAPATGQSEAPQRSKQAGRTRGDTAAPAKQRSFLYLAPGLGVLSGLSGGQDFERTNPALTAALGIEIPLGGATGLGFELNGDLELAGQADRGTYTAVALRARLAQMLAPRNRLWGAVGIGGAGYQSGSLAFAVAAGTSLMLVPKFGLDFSANLNLLGAASSVDSAGMRTDYGGGAVLLIAIRALFEFHR
ncbi:MAG: hypothetical protein WDO74_28550 [Pseudomonadota bacterium]